MADPFLHLVRHKRGFAAFVAEHVMPNLPEQGLALERSNVLYLPGEHFIAILQFGRPGEPRSQWRRVTLTFESSEQQPRSGGRVVFEDNTTRCTMELFPEDRRLPGLAAVLAPAFLQGLSERFGDGRGGVSAQVLGYSPHSRAVIRYRLPGKGAVVGKVYEDREISRRVWHNLQHIEAQSGDSPLTTPGLEYDDGVCLVLMESVSGPTLDEVLNRYAEDIPGAEAALATTAAALARLHRLPAEGIEPTSLEREYGKFIAATAALAEEQSDRLKALTAAAEEVVRSGSERRLIHGGFKAPQVIMTVGGCRLVDLDSSGSGDPAWDLGRFTAKLRGDSLAPGRSHFQDLEQRFIDLYLRETDVDREGLVERARAYQALELVRMALGQLVTHPPATFRSMKNRTRPLIEAAERCFRP